jgi:hypothetical protein
LLARLAQIDDLSHGAMLEHRTRKWNALSGSIRWPLL